MPAEAWFVLSALLAPIGYVMQDVVADAMTVEAVPRVDDERHAHRPRDARKLMHTTMQTLGRVAIIGGSVLVALINLYLLRRRAPPAAGREGRAHLPQRLRSWRSSSRSISVLGVVLARCSSSGATPAACARQGYTPRAGRTRCSARAASRTPVNWWILGGSLAFVVFTLAVGLGEDALQRRRSSSPARWRSSCS